MKSLFHSREFVAFVITGGIAAAINFLSRIAYNVWLDFSLAVIAAYLTGMVTAFLLAKFFVFKNSSSSLHRSAIYFALVNLVAILQTWLISMALVTYLLPQLGIQTFAREIAHAVGVAAPVFTSYFGHKYLSFK